MARGSKKKNRDAERSEISELSDDLPVEIISRVPYKSTRCCKCVCRRWRDLVSDPDHSKKLPQSTLAGFFYATYNENRNPNKWSRHYHNVSGNWCPRIDPYLSFLPGCEGPDIGLLDTCNGLLLCRRWKRRGAGKEMIDYVVCNPATEKWVAVPATKWSGQVWYTRLGFDPAISSHFHVFEFVRACAWDAKKDSGNTRIKAVGIYSSKSGVWAHGNAWEHPVAVRHSACGAFFNGAMYLPTIADLVVAVVDVEGNSRVIPIPTPHDSDAGFDVCQSRGQLYLANHGDSELSVWVLEDFCTENWILKHKVSHSLLFGKDYASFPLAYDVIIHPDHNVMLLLWTEQYPARQTLTTLMSYAMDSKEPRVICELGWGCKVPYLQYVPFFSLALADGH